MLVPSGVARRARQQAAPGAGGPPQDGGRFRDSSRLRELVGQCRKCSSDPGAPQPPLALVRTRMPLRRECSDPCGEAGLEGAVTPGDVLFVRGSGGLVELGTAGGLLGHVMVVTRPPVRILCQSEEGRWLRPIWPGADVAELWKVRTCESTRGRAGLHEADTLVHVSRETRQLTFIGAVVDNEVEVSGEAIELWQSPDELRMQLSQELVNQVVSEMKTQCASWSWTTAARALFMSAGSILHEREDKAQLLKEISDCWARDPICTSVVISFWQRCLCKMAEAANLSAGHLVVEPSTLIMRWMPLKADRSLPGKLMKTMRRCRWKRKTDTPGPTVALPMAICHL